MKPDFTQYGFTQQDNLIMAFIGGSQMHGAKIAASEDTDWYGVYIEPKELILRITPVDRHYVFTTGGKKGGNGPDDVDLVLYSLDKFFRLAATGNPSILHFFFAEETYARIVW